MTAPEAVRTVEHVLGKRAVAWERPECDLTAAHRWWIAELLGIEPPDRQRVT